MLDRNEIEVPLPRGKKTLAFLAILGLSIGQPVRRSYIADMLWGNGNDQLARTNLRQGVRALRAALAPIGEDVLETTADTAMLRGLWVDTRRIMDLWSAGGAPGAHMLTLASRGGLLDHLDGVTPAFDSWLAAERIRLKGQIETLSERYLSAVETNEGPDALLDAARRLLALDRAHEGAWRALMRAQLARGERGLASRAFEDCKAALREALDATPSAETESLAVLSRGGTPAPQSLARVPPATPVLFQPHGIRQGMREGGREQMDVRVAVMPPRVLGPDVEEYMALAVAEDLSDDLARFRWLMVLSPSSLAGLPELSHNSLARYRELGLDYLVTGTLMRVPGTGLRLTVRLLNLNRGGEIAWTRRIQAHHDLSSLLAHIPVDIVARLDPTLLFNESLRVRALDAMDNSPYQHVLSAIPLLDRIEKDAHARAGDHLRRAIAMEPDYAAAHAWYALWHGYLIGQGWYPVEKYGEAAERAGWHAERALLLDPEDALALTLAGHARAFLQHKLSDAYALHERALTLNPNLPAAWAFSAAAACYLGDAKDAMRRLERYKYLAPTHPQAAVLDTIFAMTYALNGAWEDVVSASQRVVGLNPRFTTNLKMLSSALGHLGRLKEAAAINKNLLSIEPGFTVAGFNTLSPIQSDHRQTIAHGLLLAGIPP